MGDDRVYSRTLTISNSKGLHARAAAKFVQLASDFDAQITVVRDGTIVDGRSIMGLLMLAASPGTVIELQAAGREAEKALAAIGGLVEAKFLED